MLGGSVIASKMPMDVYIRTAKIEVISGDPERYQTALDYLDSLSHYYGPVPEAMFWKSQIYVDFIEKAPDLDKKREYVALFAAYVDSLKLACNDKDVKSKYRKDCEKGDKFIVKSDSTLVKFWREFYNAGVEQLQEIKVIEEDMKSVADSSSKAFYDKKLADAQDSCLVNMELALALDAMDHKPYLGIATIYEQRGEFDKSNATLEKALEFVTDESSKNQMLLQIAYNMLNADKYCESIPYLKQYVDNAVTDLANMYNLAAVYNRCEKYDSAQMIYGKMLELEPTNTDALTGIGKFYNQMALGYMDSSKVYRQQGDSVKAAMWQKERDQAFDSAKTLFQTAFDAAPDDQSDTGVFETHRAGTGKRGELDLTRGLLSKNSAVEQSCQSL